MRGVAWLIIICSCGPLSAQGGPPPGGGRRGGGPPPQAGPSGKRELVAQFDADGNGRLNAEERIAARKFVKENPSGRRRRGRGGRGGRGGEPPPIIPGPKFTLGEAKHHPEADLYEPSVIRTFFFEFENDDWEAELADFYRTDVTVTAKVTVDGKEYADVGVNFRGNSSFFTVSNGRKRSLNLQFDAFDSKQRLYGYQTLNLLNAHTDPSYLREFLFSMVAGHYLPAPKANFVKVVINGESWGIYVNAQQYNRDFLRDWFGTRKGTRWKVPPGRGGGGGGLNVRDNPEEYRQTYQLKAGKAEGSYEALHQLCQALADTPADAVEEKLDPILNIDRALWFLAVDNVLIDGDGYVSRGSDYAIYRDPTGRFHLIPHDSNETFRYAGGGGPGFRREISGVEQPPMIGADDDRVPLFKTLVSNPALRARYLHHVRTVANEWLDWKKLGPVVDAQRALLDPELAIDVKMLTTYEQFKRSATEADESGRRRTPSLKEFADDRRQYLLTHDSLAGPWPKITKVKTRGKARPGKPTAVRIEVDASTPATRAFLYFATSPLGRYERVPATRGSDGSFAGSIPAQADGTRVRYYAEVRNESGDRVDFYPSNTELGALRFRVRPEKAPLARKGSAPAVVISEVMAVNTKTLADGSGQFRDWIELHNASSSAVDLGGFCLSDDDRHPGKWRFPAGTEIPAAGYLIVWAGGRGSGEALHAPFGLSAKGEKVVLCNPKQEVVDSLRYKNARPDRSFGRSADAKIGEQSPTPGRANKASGARWF